jgi:hypothetical protein
MTKSSHELEMSAASNIIRGLNMMQQCIAGGVHIPSGGAETVCSRAIFYIDAHMIAERYKEAIANNSGDVETITIPKAEYDDLIETNKMVQDFEGLYPYSAL